MFNTFVQTVLMSSKDPQAVSLTVRGLLLHIVPVVLLLAQFKGIPGVTNDSLNAVVDQILNFVSGILYVVSVIMVTWGLLRKMFTKSV